MARSVLLKFLALLVAAALLLTALASGSAVIGLALSGMYSMSPDDMRLEALEGRLYYLSERILQRYLSGGLSGHEL